MCCVDECSYTMSYIEGGIVALTSIDIDADSLRVARQLTGASSNREAVDVALRTLIAVRRQPAAVERIIARRFDDDQIDAPTIPPSARSTPAPDTRADRGIRRPIADQ